MRGETILCIATRRWNSLWRDSQQIMSRISAQNRVLYFEPGRDPDRPHLAEMRRNWPSFLRLRTRQVAPNITGIETPSCLPYGRRNLPGAVLRLTTPAVARTNAAILLRQVRRVCRALDVRQPILWLYEPRHIALAGKFGEKLVCYYNYDEMAEFEGNERIGPILRHYDDLLSKRADLVFATSRGQWERRRKLNPNTHFVPNGVDFNLFNRALDDGTPIPPEVASLPRPVIGYAGWLGYQVDAQLLCKVAQAYPQGSLAIVGPDCLPASEWRERLHRMPNIHFLGKQALEAMPTYLKGFDVALIPYAVRGHVLTVYPLKLHEYLAAGRTVVASAMPELRPFSGVVRIGEDHEHFIAQIGCALAENSPGAVHARVEIARQNTWDRRVADIHKVLDEFLSTQERSAA